MTLADLWQKISDFLVQLTGMDETIVGFLCVPLLLPFLAGLLMLFFFRKDKMSLLAALFTLKPVAAYPIWWWLFSLLQNANFPDWLSALESPLLSFLPLVPAILLTAMIVFAFRTLFKQRWLAWLWLGGDILRWLNTFILFAFPGNSETSSSVMLIVFTFGLVFPSFYALLALVIVTTRYLWMKHHLFDIPGSR